MSTDLAAELADIQRARFDRLWARLTVRQRRIVTRSLDAFEEQLNRTRRGSWSAASSAATMIQIAQGVKGLSTKQLASLRRALPGVAAMAQDSTAKWLKLLDQTFAGSAAPLKWETLEWLEDYRKPLLRSRLRIYRKSFARYGAQAVSDIEDAIAQRVLVGTPWTDAREEVMAIVREQVEGKQWMVDRIVRTESATIYNSTTMAALHAEDDDPDDPMLKKLVATFDAVTAMDSRVLHGQTRKLSEPFRDPRGHEYMAPPNRPNDREIVVGWRNSWGDDRPFDLDTATPVDEGEQPPSEEVDLEKAIADAVEEAEPKVVELAPTAPAPGPVARVRPADPIAAKRFDEKMEQINKLDELDELRGGMPAETAKAAREGLAAQGWEWRFRRTKRGIRERTNTAPLPRVDDFKDWDKVVEAELRDLMRLRWAPQPSLIDTLRMHGDDVASAYVSTKHLDDLGRASLNLEFSLNSPKSIAATLDGDLDSIKAGHTAWLSAAHYDADAIAAIREKYAKIKASDDVIKAYTHVVRHEFGHGVEYSIQALAKSDLEARRVYEMWEKARDEVSRATWGPGGRPDDDEDGIMDPEPRPGTWYQISEYGSTTDGEAFAESFALAYSGNIDKLPEPLREPMRMIVEQF